jgi:Tol biopolymer transport system component
MTVDDLWAMERVGSPALSPDGRRVAFTVTRFDEDENKGDSDIWIVDTAGASEPRRLTWNEGPDSGPFWSPDGNHLGFLSKRGEASASQIYLLPMGGGEAEPVTDLPFSPAAPLWSPDGGKIYFLGRTWPDLNDDFEEVKKRLDERKEDKTQVRATDTRLVRYWDHYLTDGRSTHIFVLDLESREVRDLLPGSERLLPFWSNSGTFDLSPDGTEIVFSANVTAPPFRTLNFDLHVMPAIGGEPRNVTPDNPAADSSPRYSPDGRSILYGRNLRPEIAPDFTRMALYDRETRTSAPLAEDWDGQPGGWRFTPDGRTVVFHAQERGRVNLYSVPVAGGREHRRRPLRAGRSAGLRPAVLHRADGTDGDHDRGRAPSRVDGVQPRALGRTRPGYGRGHDVRGRRRRRRPDVRAVAAGIRRLEEVAVVDPGPRRPARCLDRFVPLPLERRLVGGSGLRDRGR